MMALQYKKIFIIASTCAAAIVIFWAFMYFPAAGRLKSIRAQLDSVKREISDIESRSGKKAGDIAWMVGSMQSEFKQLDQKFPAGEEDALKLLSSGANRLKLEILYMRPQQKTAVTDAQGNRVFIDGKQCCSMPVLMEVVGFYKDIGEYLKWLREDFPALLTIESVSIMKDESRVPQLDAKMELVLYMLGEGQ